MEGLDSLATTNLFAQQPWLPSRSEGWDHVVGCSPVETSALCRVNPKNLGEGCREGVSAGKVCSAAAIC